MKLQYVGGKILLRKRTVKLFQFRPSNRTYILLFFFLLSSISMASLLISACNGSESANELTLSQQTSTFPPDAEVIFYDNCGICHILQGDCEGVAPPPIGPRERVEAYIRWGTSGTMPSFQGTLSEEEIAVLVDFLSAEYERGTPWK
jgi:hypothetical protein